MTKAHAGSSLGLSGDFILPVDFQDRLMPFYWNADSGRQDYPDINVSTHVPDSKFGQVVAVEKSTTNLVSNPDFAVDITGWINGSWTSFVWRNSPNPITGKRGCLHLVDDAGTTGFGHFRISSLTAPFTITAYVRPLLGNIQMVNCGGTIFYTDGTYSDYTWDNATTKKIYLGNGLYKLEATIPSMTAGKTFQYYDLRISHSDTLKTELEVYAVQAETLNFSTSFVNGTRGTSRIEYPKSVVPNGDFTINVWAAHTGDTRYASNGFKFLALGMDVPTSMLTLWNYFPIDTDSRKIISDYGNDNSGIRQYKDLTHGTPFVPGNWEMITIRYTKSLGLFEFYRNGQYWQGHTPAKINPINSLVLYDSGWKYSNLLICPRRVGHEEIEAWYDYGKPFYDPYDYTIVYE